MDSSCHCCDFLLAVGCGVGVCVDIIVGTRVVVFGSLHNGTGPLGVALGVDSGWWIPLCAQETGAMQCDVMRCLLGNFEACYMLVSDLAEAEVGRSGGKTLIDRESITVESYHDTVDLCGWN